MGDVGNMVFIHGVLPFIVGDQITGLERTL